MPEWATEPTAIDDRIELRGFSDTSRQQLELSATATAAATSKRPNAKAAKEAPAPVCSNCKKTGNKESNRPRRWCCSCGE
jgi:hypothetical protein